MLLEALAAIDRFITARLEGHLRLLPAIRADRGIHLPRATVAIAASAPAGALAGRAALWAAAGLIRQPPAGVELLLSRREEELTSAVATLQRHIAGQMQTLFSDQTALRHLTNSTDAAQ